MPDGSGRLIAMIGLTVLNVILVAPILAAILLSGLLFSAPSGQPDPNIWLKLAGALGLLATSGILLFAGWILYLSGLRRVALAASAATTIILIVACAGTGAWWAIAWP